MGSEKEKEFVKRHAEPMESSKEKKKKLSNEKVLNMITLLEDDPEIQDLEPLQVRHPIVNWEIHNDDLQSAWKIIRLGGEQVLTETLKIFLKHVTEMILILFGS